MLHEWTLKTLRYVKEVRQKQPHVTWFYLNKILGIYFILLLFGTVCKNHYFLKIWFLKYPLKSTMPKIFVDIYLELPGCCSGQESAYQCRRHGSIPGLGRSPGDEFPVFFPGKSHGQRSLGLQPIRSQRVGHNRAHTAAAADIYLLIPVLQMLTRRHKFCFHLETILIVSIYFRTLFGTNF